MALSILGGLLFRGVKDECNANALVNHYIPKLSR
jgi:hypothetical protein